MQGNLVNSKHRRPDINSKVKTRLGMGCFEMFLLTGRFVSWETAKVLNYVLFEEAISGLADFPPPFMLWDITNDFRA